MEENEGALHMAKKIKEFDNRMFAICPKCESKVYKFVAEMEQPKGKHILALHCPFCARDWNHIIWSDKAHKREQMMKAAELVDKDNLMELGKRMFKKMGD